jgi:hypothetical protein
LLGDGVHTFQYDHEGNLIKKIAVSTADSSDYEEDYSWDYHDRLVSIAIYSISNNGATKTLTQTIDYTYNAAGQRISRDEGTGGVNNLGQNNPTYDVYIGGQLYMEVGDALGIGVDAFNHFSYVSHRYLYGPAVDEVLASESLSYGTSNGVNWGLGDAQGTIRDVVNSSGVIQDHREFNSFGAMTQSNVAIDYIFGLNRSVRGARLVRGLALAQRSLLPLSARRSQSTCMESPDRKSPDRLWPVRAPRSARVLLNQWAKDFSTTSGPTPRFDHVELTSLRFLGCLASVGDGQRGRRRRGCGGIFGPKVVPESRACPGIARNVHNRPDRDRIARHPAVAYSPALVCAGRPVDIG